MKKILSILILIACLSAQAQSIITATVTITNDFVGATNGKTITINGSLRYFTNTVTSAQNQIQAGTNILTTQTNLFYAYAGFPQSGLNLSRSSSNVVQFQSFIGLPMSVSVSAGWATLSFATNIVTGMTVFRGYYSQVGAYEKTNTANGIASYLAGDAITNPIPITAVALSKFANTNAQSVTSNGLVALIYQVGQANTNLAFKVGLANTNLTVATSNVLSGLIYQVGQNDTNHANEIGLNTTNHIRNATNDLATWISSVGLSYLIGNDIVLKNVNTTERFRADQSGGFYANFDNGNTFLTADTSFNVQLKDNVSILRYNQEAAGKTTIRSSSGNDSAVFTSVDSLSVWKPVVFNLSTWPASAEGCTTNFLSASGNSGTGATTVHSFNVPANAMTNNGATTTRTIGVTFAASSATKRTEIYFAGTQIFDTGAVANTGSGSVSIRCEVTRIDSSTVAYSCTGTSDATARVAYAKVGTIGVLSFTSTQSFYTILTSGVGGASNDFQVIIDNTRFAPSPAWGAFQ